MNIIEGKKQAEFNRLYHVFDEIYHEVAVINHLSDSAFFILYSLCELGNGCLQKDICNMFSISKQTVNSSIQNLEKAGYIRLEAGRGRDKHIFLTETGEALIEEKIVPVMQAENEVFSEMTEEEGDELIRLYKKYLMILQKNLKKIYQKAENREEENK